MSDTKQVPADGPPADRYRWVVLAASFLTMFTTASTSYASGVFHVGLLEAYPEAPLSLLVTVGSLFLSMYGPGAILASVIINEFSCRTCVILSGLFGLVGFSVNFFITDVTWLIITYGIIAGTSIGFASSGPLVVLGFYFGDNVNIATSIAVTGQALGMFGHPPLTQYLIDTFGIHGAYLIYGGISANGCIFGMLMRPSKLEKTTQRLMTSGRTRRNLVCKVLFDQFSHYSELVKNGAFLFIFFGYFAFGMSIAISFLYLPDFFQTYGETKQASALALAMSGIGSIVSRLFTGVLSRDEKAGSTLIFVGINGVIGIITFFIVAFTRSTATMMIYGFFLGVYSGGNWALISPLSLEILGLRLSACGVGFLLLGCGLGYLSGPLLSNLVFEFTGVYQHAFMFSAFAFLFTSLCGMLSSLAKYKDSSKKEPCVLSANLHDSSSVEPKGRNISLHDKVVATAEEITIFVSMENGNPVNV